jgi:DNA-directed RNA polymerase subunit RPC12/RpoP
MKTIKEEAKAYEPNGKFICIECGKKIKDKRSLRCRGCYEFFFQELSSFIKGFKGEKNGMWKGNKVSYSGIHKWIRKWKPKKELCEHCNQKKKLDVANISGEYKRDFNDYLWLCRNCHSIYDKEVKN